MVEGCQGRRVAEMGQAVWASGEESSWRTSTEGAQRAMRYDVEQAAGGEGERGGASRPSICLLLLSLSQHLYRSLRSLLHGSSLSAGGHTGFLLTQSLFLLSNEEEERRKKRGLTKRAPPNVKAAMLTIKMK